jgi:ketosteroid isomerase-like protein
MTPEHALAVHAEFAAATRAGDAGALAAISQDDAVVWHNYDDVVVDAQQSARVLRWLHRTAPDVAWTDVAVLPTPRGFVWQAMVTGTGPGGPIRAHTCVVVTLSSGGKVQRTEEYLDPAALAPLTTGVPAGTSR